MDRAEATSVLREYLDRYRDQTHAELQKLFLAPVATEVLAPSGKRYQVLVQASWVAKPGGELRVVVGVDDRGWQQFTPLVDEFTVSPEPVPAA
jgi:hypothetical protein